LCVQHPAAVDEEGVTEKVNDGYEDVCTNEWFSLICKAIDTDFFLSRLVRKEGGERQGTGMYQDGVEVIELDCKVGRATQEDETVEEDDRVREVRLVTSLGDDNDRNEEKNDIGACWPRSAGR